MEVIVLESGAGKAGQSGIARKASFIVAIAKLNCCFAVSDASQTSIGVNATLVSWGFLELMEPLPHASQTVPPSCDPHHSCSYSLSASAHQHELP